MSDSAKRTAKNMLNKFLAVESWRDIIDALRKTQETAAEDEKTEDTK